jgi:hypothetical protein
MSKALGSAINGGSTTSSIGNTSGTTQVTAPTMSSGRGGGGMGRGTFPGAGGASARGIASSVKEEEPAILMELKVDAKGKLTGEVQEITTSPVFALKKAKVEEGTVTDKKFEFKTTEKSEKVSNTTRWVGELTDDQTITVNRLTKGGQPIDSGALVLHRGK